MTHGGGAQEKEDTQLIIQWGKAKKTQEERKESNYPHFLPPSSSRLMSPLMIVPVIPEQCHLLYQQYTCPIIAAILLGFSIGKCPPISQGFSSIISPTPFSNTNPHSPPLLSPLFSMTSIISTAWVAERMIPSR